MWGDTVLLEPLVDPDDLFPSTKCCLELTKHLDITIFVDCHTVLIIILESEWFIDAMLGNDNPHSAL